MDWKLCSAGDLTLSSVQALLTPRACSGVCEDDLGLSAASTDDVYARLTSDHLSPIIRPMTARSTAPPSSTAQKQMRRGLETEYR